MTGTTLPSIQTGPALTGLTDNLKQLANIYVSDPNFQQALHRDPVTALAAKGFNLTTEELDTVSFYLTLTTVVYQDCSVCQTGGWPSISPR